MFKTIMQINDSKILSSRTGAN